MQKFILFTDGGSRGNPGPAGAGVVITDERGQTLKTVAKPLGVLTNNQAEYQAVIVGLESLKRWLGKARLAEAQIEIRLDSELVARQLRGEYQIKEADLQPLFLKIWNLRVKDFPRLAFVNVAREENRAADRLANEAMDLPALPTGQAGGRQVPLSIGNKTLI